MKNTVKYILQKGLGFERYLYWFAHFKIRSLRKDKNEQDFFHFLALLKNEKSGVLDIGANIGIMTYYLATNLSKAQIHSIEPIPVNFGVLKRIVDKYNLKNVELHPIALGNEQGYVRMVLPYNGGTKMQGLSHVKHESISDWNEGEEFDVPVRKLDDLFLNDTIQAIKIDIENFEYFAFLGGIQLIEKNKPVIYAELWDNDNRKKCFDLLSSLGYSILVVENNRLVLFNPDEHKNQNFIFQVRS